MERYARSGSRNAAPRKTLVPDTASPSANPDSEPPSKRRKVRKGTRSCWDCRRRKLKCVFDSHNDSQCVGCQQRGTKCTSQDLPEELPSTSRRGNRIGNRVVRVEALVEQLIKKIGSNAPVERAAVSEPDIAESNGIPTPSSTHSGFTIPQRVVNLPSAPSKYLELSRQLHEALPSSKDIELLCQAESPTEIPLFHEILTLPYAVIDKEGLEAARTFLEIPGPDAHPVLLARYMLRLTAYLQHPHVAFVKVESSLSEPLQSIVLRLTSITERLVTGNDELTGCIEGLECLMLESHCHLHRGNLRRSWVAIRKTIAIAQLMGIDRQNHNLQLTRLDPRTRADPSVMWFRMNLNDRHLCLMLGLPQASHDRTMASDEALAADTLDGRIERLHCAFQSRLLERYDSGGKYAGSMPLRELDKELKRIARTMPSTWWLLPNFSGTRSDPKALFWELSRLILQLNHYNLLLQLHNPHMLTSSSYGGCEYSRTTCTTAAREVLSRFIIFRNSHESGFGCRTLEFFALTAALTLVLSYLNAHQTTSPDDLPGHQYLSDRGMMEQMQKSMEETGRKHGDSLSIQCADLLRRLLAIEAQAAAGHVDSVNRVSVEAPDKENARSVDEATAVRVHIPYFGVINIAREGFISKEPAVPQCAASGHVLSDDDTCQDTCGTSLGQVRENSNNGFGKDPVAVPSLSSRIQDAPGDVAGDSSAMAEIPFTDVNPDIMFSQQAHPGLVAGIDDWAFQGVDMAFFDNLMSGVQNGS